MWGSLRWLLHCSADWMSTGWWVQQLMSTGWENWVWSLPAISIWKENLHVGNTVKGSEKTDVVIVTEKPSKGSVASVIPKLKR